MFTGIESQIESNDNKMDYLFLSHGHWSHDDIHYKNAKRSEQIISWSTRSIRNKVTTARRFCKLRPVDSRFSLSEIPQQHTNVFFVRHCIKGEQQQQKLRCDASSAESYKPRLRWDDSRVTDYPDSEKNQEP